MDNNNKLKQSNHRWFITAIHANSICNIYAIQSDQPSVLDIGADQNQAQSQVLCKKLTKQLGCPIVLSLNLEIGLNSATQIKIIKYLKEIEKKINLQKSKQMGKMEEALN